MANFNETGEMLDALGNTVSQGITSFSDGFQFGEDVPDFFDELFTDWPKAVKGLVEEFGPEMQAATPEQISFAIDLQTEKWNAAGMDENVAFLIGSGLKTTFAGLSLAAKNKAKNPDENLFLK